MFKGAGSERGNVLSRPLHCLAVDFIWSVKPGISSWGNLSWVLHRLPVFYKYNNIFPISPQLRLTCPTFISKCAISVELDKYCCTWICERLKSAVTSVTPPLAAKRSSKWHLKIAGVDWITDKWMQCLLLAESWVERDTVSYMNLKCYMIYNIYRRFTEELCPMYEARGDSQYTTINLWVQMLYETFILLHKKANQTKSSGVVIRFPFSGFSVETVECEVICTQTWSVSNTLHCCGYTTTAALQSPDGAALLINS